MKKTFNILLVLMITFFSIPFGGSTVFANGKVYDNIKDGEYDIIAKALNADTGKPSGAAKFLSEEAKLLVENGEVELTITIPHNDMAEIKDLKVEGIKPTVVEDGNTKLMTFKLKELKAELLAEVHYIVPSIGMDHTVPFKFALEGLDELPTNEQNPDNTTIQLDNGTYTIDASYLHDTEDKPSAMARYMDSPVFLSVQDNHVELTITVNAHETVTKLQVNGKNAVEKVVDGNNRYETFRLDSLESLLSGYVEYQAPYGDSIHYGKANFRILLDEASAKKVPASEKPGYEEDEDVDEDKVVEKKIKQGEETPVNSGDKITISGDENTQLTLPEGLPEGTTLEINSVKDKEYVTDNNQDLIVAGEVYEFNFSNLGDNPGKFELTMGYDTSKFNSKDVDIYYYNEAKDKWIEQKGTVKDGTITIQPTHFSTYGVFAKENVKPEKPGTPIEKPKQDPGTPSNQDELVPDNAYEIDYVVKHETEDKLSSADSFFVKPGILLEKDGEKYLQLTVKNSSMIDSLETKYGEVILVKENNNDSMVVQLKVDDLSEAIYLSMHITVPGLYSDDHKARIIINPNSLVKVNANKFQLMPGSKDNGNGPIVNGVTPGKTIDPDPNNDNNLTPTPNKPKFGSNTDNNDANGLKSTGSNPKTGDTTSMLLYVLLLVGSAIPLAIKFRRRSIL